MKSGMISWKTMSSGVSRSVLANNSYQNSYMNSWKFVNSWILVYQEESWQTIYIRIHGNSWMHIWFHGNSWIHLWIHEINIWFLVYQEVSCQRILMFENMNSYSHMWFIYFHIWTQFSWIYIWIHIWINICQYSKYEFIYELYEFIYK